MTLVSIIVGATCMAVAITTALWAIVGAMLTSNCDRVGIRFLSSKQKLAAGPVVWIACALDLILFAMDRIVHAVVKGVAKLQGGFNKL